MAEQANLGEFCGESLDEECEEKKGVNEERPLPRELEFTGNWFIDAGILGFVNLMEEVYGWNLEELRNRIKDKPEVVYYGYFPFAFVYYNNKLRGNIAKFTPDCLKELECLKSKKEIFEEVWKRICNIKEFITKTSNKKENRIDLSSKGRFYYFHNLLFFQPSWGLKKQKNAFMEILELKNISEDVLNYIDKTINKFLPSMDEFSNVPYTHGFITPETLLNLHPLSFIFILSFPLSFIEGLRSGNILFYSPELKFTYHINKKLNALLGRLNDKLLIFRITWRSIIDSVVETQSIWTLENMYLIKYTLGKNQNILNAEYIGISKLQASVIIEDSIREALNASLKIGKDQQSSIWVLEEFIKNKSLYELILKYVYYRLGTHNGRDIYRKVSLYSLAIDAKIKENNEIDLFSSKFFRGYRSLVDEIKDCYSLLNRNANSISKLFESQEERMKFSYSLMSALKKRNRITFINILLKKFLENSGEKEISYLNKFVFENIVSNDVSWENYALALIVGILSFGGDVSGDKSNE